MEYFDNWARKYSLLLSDNVKAGLLFVFQALILWVLILSIRPNLEAAFNRVDVLPLARQLFEPGWLPQDWYLNLSQPHRVPFGLLFGWVSSVLNFDASSLVLRLVLFLILAVSMNFLLSSAQIHFPIRIIAIYLFLQRQSLAPNEWIVGGAESKVLAYSLLFVSLGFILRNRPGWSALTSGLGISFHVLVGIYSTMSLGFGVVLSKIIKWPSIRTAGVWLIFFLTGSVIGIWTAIQRAGLTINRSTTAYQDYYVMFRHPHHFDPTAWIADDWIFKLLGAILFFTLIFIMSKSPDIRFLSAFSLGTALLFVFGILLSEINQINLLGLYWFRLGDVMIPFMALVLAGLLLSRMIDRLHPLSFLGFNS